MNMLKEVFVNLDAFSARVDPAEDKQIFGKALAVEKIIKAEDPERTLYLSGYTPVTASGLGFAGKLNVYGVSLLGKNLQGSRSGGLLARHLTRHGIVGIQIAGDAKDRCMLVIDKEGRPSLQPLELYGSNISGTFSLARAIYGRHQESAAIALTDPATTGFRYNAIACNDKPGSMPHRVAGRGTTRFGPNGLVGVVVEKAIERSDKEGFDQKKVAELLRKFHKYKHNLNLTGSTDSDHPLLGGTFGGAAKVRFENGHGLTNLFRSARVPDAVFPLVLPNNIVKDQLRLAAEHGIKITRHSCMPGCPNRCSQVVLLTDKQGAPKVFRAGEWETYQGIINLGIFEDAVRTAAEVIEHSNIYAYDHIEGLVTLAALALVTETKLDTGVRYGDKASIMDALEQAARGKTDLGMLIRQGAAAAEKYYGLERHFTVSGHALPFHNGRSLLQTGVGLSWTFGRHGESCAGPGRLNFLGRPYNPADHSLSSETHVLNTIHGMIMYGAMDELGTCFFIGPNIDTLVDMEFLLKAMGIDADTQAMIRDSAATIRKVHAFNQRNGTDIQSLPRTFYEDPTYGNGQSPDEAVVFNVPFEVIRDYGSQVLKEVAEGKQAVPAERLDQSRARYA